MCKNKKANAEYPFEHGADIILALDAVSIHPVTTKIRTSFLTQLPERKEISHWFHYEANGDFKSVREFNGCDGGWILRMENGGWINIVVMPQY